jgi:hypothetical protein
MKFKKGRTSNLYQETIDLKWKTLKMYNKFCYKIIKRLIGSETIIILKIYEPKSRDWKYIKQILDLKLDIDLLLYSNNIKL